MDELSVVIPIDEKEENWEVLVTQVREMLGSPAIIISAPTSLSTKLSQSPIARRGVKLVFGDRGRAKQLNRGAKEAKGKSLLFLHADSVLQPGCDKAIHDVLSKGPDGIFYFDLIFGDKFSPLMRLNEFGANFRSRVLRLPFGDQGFLISSSLFQKLGGFDETAKYGEDYLLIWKAHLSGAPVLPLRVPLKTSARKYQEHGWLNTTALHLKVTARQALPRLASLIKQRINKDA